MLRSTLWASSADEGLGVHLPPPLALESTRPKVIWIRSSTTARDVEHSLGMAPHGLRVSIGRIRALSPKVQGYWQLSAPFFTLIKAQILLNSAAFAWIFPCFTSIFSQFL
ncbi:MAG: hypothetical protein BMS9Abin08_1135 [Gammaproteobacteria bacterium]|nr:MAG: hypothetical protein BMS9Abin08_1135 [Gammaproteobacteria bacterium]